MNICIYIQKGIIRIVYTVIRITYYQKSDSMCVLISKEW